MTSDDTALSRIARFFLVLLVLTLLFCALFSLSACSQGTNDGTVRGMNEGALFSLSACSQGTNDGTVRGMNEGAVRGIVSTYVDPETGVNYVEFKSGYSLCVCVRVNADGTPYVSEVGD